MNYLCLNEEFGKGDTFTLRDPMRVKHIKQVLKKSIGDTIKIIIINHGATVGTITKMTDSSVTFSLGLNFQKKDMSPKITLAVGACRPLMTKRILEHATTLGVSEFVFFRAQNSEKSYLDSKVLSEENYKKYLIKGLEQTGTYYQLPSVQLRKSIHEVSVKDYDQKIFLHGPGETIYRIK